MSIILRLRNGISRSFWIPCLVFSTLSVLLTVRQSIPLGLGISPDSVVYVKTARSLMENGFADLFHDIGVVYPLGYPAVLAAAGWLTRLDPLDAAVLVNGILAVLLVLFFMKEARRLPGLSPWLSGTIIIFSLALSLMAAMALSELLFTFIAFMTMRKAVTCEPGVRSSLVLGLMTFAAYLTKYIGITLVPVVALQLFLLSRDAPRKGVKDAAVYLVTAGVLIGAYTVRNHLVSGTFWSFRPPSSYSLADTLYQTRGTLVGWFLPEVPQTWWLLWGLPLVLGAFLWVTRHHLMRQFREHATWFAVYPAFILVYLAVLNYTASRYAFDGLGSRLLVPIYPAVALTLLFLVAPGRGPGTTPRLTLVARWLLVLILIAQPVRLVFKDTHRRGKEGGGGYNQPMWRESHLVHGCLPPLDLSGERVFSNGPDILYILAGVEAETMPKRNYYNSEMPTGVTADNVFDRYPGLEGSFLVLFDDTAKRRPYLFTRDEMDEMCRMELVAECRDGTVFRILGPRTE